MYDIFVETHFAGAHHLRNYKGSCERPHGHNWKVKVTVHCTELDHCDMSIDFKILKKITAEIIDQLDHQDLNELPHFATINTSSERIAEFLFYGIKDRLHDKRCALRSVQVKETDTQGVIYYGAES